MPAAGLSDARHRTGTYRCSAPTGCAAIARSSATGSGDLAGGMNELHAAAKEPDTRVVSF
jgi:hypothetical protein